VEKSPAARRRPKSALEAYFLYIERAPEGGNEETWAEAAYPRRMKVSYPALYARITGTF
jgi:hypothetical protein